MKTKQEILDYVKSRKEYYENEINWCQKKLDAAAFNSNDFKVYQWLNSEYLTRLNVINDILNFINGKDE